LSRIEVVGKVDGVEGEALLLGEVDAEGERLGEGLTEGEVDEEGEIELLGEGERLILDDGETEGETDALGDTDALGLGLEIGMARISINPVAVGLAAESVKESLAELPRAL
jgi:hypothetical protein